MNPRAPGGGPASGPLISVVTVVKDDAEALRVTLDSVASQTFSDLEYIVVDGGSTDGTLELIRGSQARVDRLVSEPDRGIFDAMNRGAALARGRWIQFLNAGDRYLGPATLERLAPSLRGDLALDLDLVHTGYRVSGRDFAPDLSLAYLFRKMVCHQSMFFRREALLGAGGFDVTRRHTADFDFVIRHFSRLRVRRVELCAVEYDPSGISSRPDNYRHSWRERIPSLMRADLPPAYRAAAVFYALCAWGYRTLKRW